MQCRAPTHPLKLNHSHICCHNTAIQHTAVVAKPFEAANTDTQRGKPKRLHQLVQQAVAWVVLPLVRTHRISSIVVKLLYDAFLFRPAAEHCPKTVHDRPVAQRPVVLLTVLAEPRKQLAQLGFIHAHLETLYICSVLVCPTNARRRDYAQTRTQTGYSLKVVQKVAVMTRPGKDTQRDEYLCRIQDLHLRFMFLRNPCGKCPQCGSGVMWLKAPGQVPPLTSCSRRKAPARDPSAWVHHLPA